MYLYNVVLIGKKNEGTPMLTTSWMTLKYTKVTYCIISCIWNVMNKFSSVPSYSSYSVMRNHTWQGKEDSVWELYLLDLCVNYSDLLNLQTLNEVHSYGWFTFLYMHHFTKNITKKCLKRIFMIWIFLSSGWILILHNKKYMLHLESYLWTKI